MRRTVSAFCTVALAMLLSVSLAVPASAADLWKDSTDPKFKYGLDYWKFMTSGGGGTPAGPVSPVKQPVSPSLNPSNTGGSWYLQNQKDKAAGTRTVAPQPNGKVLTGKIIEPGKTIVRAPSTYAPITKYAGKVIGGSLFMGSGMLGVGGTSAAPSNRKEIALSQGVSAGCVDGTATCTADEIKKQFNIDGCGINGNCAAIGAKDPNGGDFGQWFKTDALPFLEDLWEQITGQKEAEDWPDANGHYTVNNNRGCVRSVDRVVFDEDNKNLRIDQMSSSGLPRPPLNTNGTHTVPSSRWEADCAASVVSQVTTFENTNIDIICISPSNGRTTHTDGTSYGYSWVMNLPGAMDEATDKVKAATCRSGGTYPTDLQIFSVQFRHNMSQASFDGSPSQYVTTRYTNHYNPNPSLADVDTTEQAKITTTVDCKTPDGQVFTLSQSIDKTAAFVAPQCPQGSDLVRHDVTSSNGATTQTLDSGAEVPGSKEKYPGCFGSTGCSMEVHLDGSKCSATRTDCLNWPAVAAQTPSRVKCMWGTYTVPTSDCNVLSNAYKSESGVVFDPRSGTWIAIDTYGNPVAPNPEPWNPTNPAPVAGAAPGTSPSTGTAPGATPMPITGTAPSLENVNCAARGWSWNPTEWVENPIGCALQRAFVPKTDVAARSAEIQAIVTTKAPFTFMAPVMTGPGGGGCPNWVVSLPGFEKNVVCDSSFTAAILGARAPMFGLVTAAMVWPLIRSLWYAAIPILRASPSK